MSLPVRYKKLKRDMEKLSQLGQVKEIVKENMSTPPPGMYKVTNLYFDPETGRLAVVYKGD